MMKTKTALAILCLVGAGLSLQSCRVYSDGNLVEKRVEVHQSKFHDQRLMRDADDTYLTTLADHYQRFGDGPVYASITYDPKSKNATAMHATQMASDVSAKLRAAGVRDVKVDIIPVKDQGAQSHLLINYDTYTAHAPRDCDVLPGFEDTDHTINDDYKMGCTIETVIARQIHRPKDLAGDRALSSSRSAAGIWQNAYPALSNEQNSALGGESSTN